MAQVACSEVPESKVEAVVVPFTSCCFCKPVELSEADVCLACGFQWGQATAVVTRELGGVVIEGWE